MGDEGNLFTENIDATGTRLRLSNTVTTIAVTSLPAIPSGGGTVKFFEEIDSADTAYLYCICRSAATTIEVYKIRLSDDVVRNSRTFTFTGASNVTPTQVTRFDGKWYLGVRVEGTTDTQAIMELGTVNTGTGNDTWNVHSTGISVEALWTGQSLTGAKVVFRYGKVAGEIESAATGLLTEANWGGGFPVGDNTGTGKMGVNAPIPVLAKDNNLYLFDLSQNSRALIEFPATGNLDGNDGFGTITWGSRLIFYPDSSGLWRIRSLQAALPIGPDNPQLYPRFRAPDNISNVPKGFRHFETAIRGQFIYSLYGDVSGNNMFLYQGHFGVQGEPEIVWNTSIRRGNVMRGCYVTNEAVPRCVWAEPGNNRLAYITLGADGSTDQATSARGTAGEVTSGIEFYGDERNWGDPFQQKQFAGFRIERENFPASNVLSVQPKILRNEGAAQTVGSAQTGSGHGVSDHVLPLTTAAEQALTLLYRGRLQLTFTTTASYATTDDGRIPRVTGFCRNPALYRAVRTKLTKGELWALRKLVHQAVNIRAPGENETFLGEVVGLDETRVQGTDTWRAEVFVTRYEASS